MSSSRQIAAPQRVETRLWEAFARSVRNNILGEVGVQVVRVAGMVILARALAPADFGLFRVLLTITAIVMIVNELGVPDTLVQRRELRAEDENTAAWANLAVSLFTAGAMYAAAPLIARAMAMPALPPVLRLLCVPILLEGIASVSAARLTRRLEFGTLATAEVVAELAFVAIAMALLWLKMPRWSLAGGLAARLCGHALTLFSAAPYLPQSQAEPPRPARVARLRERRIGRPAAFHHLQQRRLPAGGPPVGQLRAGLLWHGVGPAALPTRPSLQSGGTGYRSGILPDAGSARRSAAPPSWVFWAT